MKNYNKGDELFIFGFSRGAYTARCLAGMLSVCGLAKQGSVFHIEEAYTRYKTADRNQDSIRKLIEKRDTGKLQNPTKDEKNLLDNSRPITIKMIGLWDTVAAIDMKSHSFFDSNLRRDMQNVFHAIALDEHRNEFLPIFYTHSWQKNTTNPNKQRDRELVEQRWFVGAHANVGGSYENNALSQLPLKWLQQKAAGLGLAFRKVLVVDDKSYSDAIADSYTDFVAPFGRLIQLGYKHLSPRHYRTIGESIVERDNYKIHIINETIDESIFRRWRKDSTYRPINLIDWAKKHKVDPAGLNGLICAETVQVLEPSV